MNLSKQLAEINQALADKAIRLRIEQRKELLNLRGPLPCPKKQGLIRHQRISLHIKADLEGLQEAEKLLDLVLFQLKHEQFQWDHWSNKKAKRKPLQGIIAIEEAVGSFKSAFFSDPNRKQSHSGSFSTWSSAYLPYLTRLKKQEINLNCNLGIDLFNKTLETYSENTRSRQQCVIALAAFAKHINLELPSDWRKRGNGYGLHKAHYRNLPSDNLIKEAWLKIPNKCWRTAYGLMATYGLRNHEVFFCDLSGLTKDGDKVLRVLPNTKTGEHQVWPFHPSWIDSFELDQLGDQQNFLPSINTDLNTTTLQKVGRRVAEQFRRYNLPLTPYDLRHAWAIRTIHIGLPDTVSARMMGHSVSIHNHTYHHWITRRDQQQAVDSALAKKAA